MKTLALWICSVHLNVLSVHASTWTAEVPGTVPALLGSCVVVPCKFSYPEDVKVPSSGMMGMWHTDSFSEFIYHKDSSKVIEKFTGRTQLIGDVTNKNCSLRINHLQKGDTGPFAFRIVIEGPNKYSYFKSMVTLDVQDSPASPSLNVTGEVSAGKAVTISCSVSHTCPSEPPQITWSHNGTLNIQSEQLQPPNGQWKVTSVLTFTPMIADHNKTLTCTAEYQQGQSAQASQLLSVKYAPVSVRAETETPVVKEGDSVQLVCSSDSNPKAHSYQWYDVTGSLQSKERILTLQKVPRDTGAFYCTASNSEGSGKSSLVNISVEYPPEMGRESGCSAHITGVTCHCVVDSWPVSEVQWILAAGTVANSSSNTENQTQTLHTLRFSLGLTDMVSCRATNKHGQKKLDLNTNQRGILMAIYIPVCLSAALILILVTVALWKCSRGREAEKTVKNPIYSNEAREKNRPSEDLDSPESEDIYANCGAMSVLRRGEEHFYKQHNHNLYHVV
ncbi:hypothetical protein JZ751_006340 [Albula glossodonta]|uniref:Ig-like domain-containing protein n=1 Tax=Albula glossodonta TaxID=121402 RepID=A0A8T2N3T5_9TELE|nr:hypothetical protein JZ751_006340 [Albula glossodonta]